MKHSITPRNPRLQAAQVLALGPALAAIALSGCGMSGASSTEQSSASAPTPTLTSPTINSPSAHSNSEPAPVARQRHAGRSQAVLAYSTASGQTVQPQPAPGSCHANGSGLYSRPDPRCTPGALNPAATQATIGRTICQAGWTDTVRPPESVTEPEKAASMAAYGDPGPMSGYEYDHFVPLELGGAVNDPRNLWPEPGASPNPKDAVEDDLRAKVCDGQMTLAQARRAITTNWVALAAPPSSQAPSSNTSRSSTAPASAPSAAGAQCTVTASYSDRYHDYDVYVHSNQPDETVTVIDAAGRTATWHTDSTGYADVYFHAPAAAAGETITAHVVGASCHGTL
jgi:hypothetical protein